MVVVVFIEIINIIFSKKNLLVYTNCNITVT